MFDSHDFINFEKYIDILCFIIIVAIIICLQRYYVNYKRVVNKILCREEECSEKK